MTIQELIDHLLALPDKNLTVRLSVWDQDGQYTLLTEGRYDYTNPASEYVLEADGFK